MANSSFDASDDMKDLIDFLNLLKSDPRLLIKLIDGGYPGKYKEVFEILSLNSDFKYVFETYRKIIEKVNQFFIYYYFQIKSYLEMNFYFFKY